MDKDSIKAANITLDTGLGLGRVWAMDNNDVPNTDVLLFEGKDYEAKQLYTLLTEAIKNFKQNRG